MLEFHEMSLQANVAATPTCMSSPHSPRTGMDDSDRRGDEPYESFKIISKKALADYHRAERIFLDFLASADVWSQPEVRTPLVECCAATKCCEQACELVYSGQEARLITCTLTCCVDAEALLRAYIEVALILRRCCDLIP
jgi:hypothetical protein